MGTSNRGRHTQYLLLDLGCEPEHPQYLGDSGAGDALPGGDGGLIGDVSRFQLGFPAKGLAEKRSDPGRSGVGPENVIRRK